MREKVSEEVAQIWNEVVSEEIAKHEDPDFRNFLMRMLI